MPRIFDWERLLKEQRIPFIESGANVKRGELNIKCPFCGSADPSFHMGLSRETGWWACWRNRSQHSGKSPLRLITKLLGCSYGHARDLAGLGEEYIDPEGFDALAARLMHRDDTTGRKEETQRRRLHLDEFAIIEPKGRTWLHRQYLLSRGFNGAGIELLGRYYGVCAGIAFPWSARVIIPYYVDDEIVTWTGRAIGDAEVRYKDLALKESLLAPKEVLFNFDCIREGGKLLVIVEGPIDALKLDLYGREYGVRAVGLSTNSISAEQAYMLQEAATKFERVAVMMDNTNSLSIMDSMRMQAELSFLPSAEILRVPYGAKDAGELTPTEVREWSKSNG